MQQVVSISRASYLTSRGATRHGVAFTTSTESAEEEGTRYGENASDLLDEALEWLNKAQKMNARTEQ